MSVGAGVARAAFASLVPGLGGCGGVQSALEPAGPAAREIEALWWAMAVGAVFIFALVTVLLLFAVSASPGARRHVAPRKLIVGGGIVLPVVVLSALVPFNAFVASGISAARQADTLTIRVHGRQWWWAIEYENTVSGAAFTTANELYLPAGEAVELILTSGDVIHSLWFPSLGAKLDLVPGRRNRLMIEADVRGVFRGQCAEFCGIAHAKMALYAVAVTPEQFTSWARRQRTAASEPQDELARAGAELFHERGCALCHAVRGHGAWGVVGPDLTHVGSRLTIGAGILENTSENIALWIAHNEALKPGNPMPDFPDLDPETRNAIAAYLDDLE